MPPVRKAKEREREREGIRDKNNMCDPMRDCIN